MDISDPLHVRECDLHYLCIFLENGVSRRTSSLPGWYMEQAPPGHDCRNIYLDDVVRGCHDGEFKIVPGCKYT